MKRAVISKKSPSGQSYIHPVHRRWFKQINATIYEFSHCSLPLSLNKSFASDIFSIKNIDSEFYNNLEEYDTLIFESPGSLYSLPSINKKYPEKQKFFLDTTWRLEGKSAHSFSTDNQLLSFIKSADREIDAKILLSIIRRYIDGAIAVSDMVASRYLLNDIPVEIARPFIQTEQVYELNNISPNLESNIVGIIGKNRNHKGFNRIIKNWEKMFSSDSSIELLVAGSGHSKKYDKFENVTHLGYVESLSTFYKQLSCLVHPALYDASPVTTLESMFSGVPTIVTYRTGTKSEVSRVDPSLVCDTNLISILGCVFSYTQQSIDIKKEFSKKSRKIGKEFTESERSHEFEQAVKSLEENQ